MDDDDDVESSALWKRNSKVTKKRRSEDNSAWHDKYMDWYDFFMVLSSNYEHTP